MNFELTKEQTLLKKAAQQFAENILEPSAAELDETHTFPVENFKLMARYGFTGIGVPKEIRRRRRRHDRGGHRGIRVCQEVHGIRRHAVHPPDRASDYRQVRHRGPEAEVSAPPDQGRRAGRLRPDEPGGGSDAAKAQTAAILDPATNEYVLNGTKCFISGGSRGRRTCVVFALTEPHQGLNHGISAFIVEKPASPGFYRGQAWRRRWACAAARPRS